MYAIGRIDNNLKNIILLSLKHFGDMNKVIYALPINNVSRPLLKLHNKLREKHQSQSWSKMKN